MPDLTTTGVSDDGKYKRHGLTRRGVRALLETYEHTGTTPAGLQRYRKSAADGEITVDIEPRTQLIAHQEFSCPDRDTRIDYQWSRNRARTSEPHRE